MPLTVKDILQYPSLSKASLITGSIGLENEVTNVMVMEALDIEEWGHAGVILLTSYFALEDALPEEIDIFFKYAKEIGIAGFIFKMDRLVNEIPETFLSNCRKYDFPLIRIDKQTTYERVMNDILESIINRNAFILKNYYEIHQQFIHLMMNQPDVLHILHNLKSLINLPVTLVEKVEKKILGTDDYYNHFQIEDKKNLSQQQYMNIQYKQYLINYTAPDTSMPSTALSISVPNLGYEEYELIIHQLDKKLKDVDFVAIENAVVALQTELVKQYALRENNRSRFNEMVSDLLHGRFNNKEDIIDTIHDLNLDTESLYRIVLFSFENKKTEASPQLLSRFSDVLINHSKVEFSDFVYVTRKEKIILIIPANTTSLKEVKTKVNKMKSKINKNQLYENFEMYTSISNKVDPFNIPEGYRQAFDTYKILQMIDEPQAIATYQDMGIYQIFVETGNLETLERFVPDKIWELQKNNPELLETLHAFIDVNQNYSDAAQILFVHPKTVRYRIDRLKENYQMNFHNPEEILQYSIAIRLLKILPKK